MKKKPIRMPKFANESEEADWRAGRKGQEFVKQNAMIVVRDLQKSYCM